MRTAQKWTKQETKGSIFQNMQRVSVKIKTYRPDKSDSLTVGSERSNHDSFDPSSTLSHAINYRALRSESSSVNLFYFPKRHLKIIPQRCFRTTMSHLCEFACGATNDCFEQSFSHTFGKNTASHLCEISCGKSNDAFDWKFCHMFYTSMASHPCEFLRVQSSDHCDWMFSHIFHRNTVSHLYEPRCDF